MKTAAELIAQERLDQIEKHGYSIKDDQRKYRSGHLLKVAMCILHKDITGWPPSWAWKWWEQFMAKDRKGQLAIAGALVMAHMDSFGTNEANKELLDEIVGTLNLELNPAVRHIAGPYLNGLQYCVICGVCLCDYRNAAWHGEGEPPKGFAEGPLWVQGKNPTMFSSTPIEPFSDCKE